MKLTDEQIEVIAKECNFDMTGRLLRFARLLIDAAQTPRMPVVVPIATPKSLWNEMQKCSACALKLHHVMGYVCPRQDCPTGLGSAS